MSRRVSSCCSSSSPVTPGLLRGLLVVGAELRLQGEVDALGLLLLAQLQTVAYDLRLAVTAVLARGKIALLNGALVGETLRALEEQLLPSRRHSRQTAPV